MAGYSQDYVKRMIEQLGQVWAEIVVQMRAGNTELAFKKLDAAYRELANMDRDLVHKTSEDYLILATMVGKVGDVDRSLVLGELLKIEAAMFAEGGDRPMRERCLSKALNILCEAYLRLNHGATPAHSALIDEIAAEMTDCDVTAITNWRLFQVYERRDLFERAEDTLHHLIDADEAYIEPGIAFYERLLKQPDHVLANGGLPRDEVQDGLDDLLDRA
jgi:hypothetical protein